MVQEAYWAAGLPQFTGQATPFQAAADELYLDLNLTPEIFKARLGLRARLNASGLAQLLPGGLENLPDIYAALPEPLAHLARHFAPRTSGRLVHHVAAHLDWYLDQSGSPMLWRRVLGPLANPVVPAVVMGLAVLVGRSLPAIEIWLVGWFLTALVATVIAMVLNFYLGLDRQRDQLNALEFYLYLRDSYRDPPESA